MPAFTYGVAPGIEKYVDFGLADHLNVVSSVMADPRDYKELSPVFRNIKFLIVQRSENKR
jgi:hypothetical protein